MFGFYKGSRVTKFDVLCLLMRLGIGGGLLTILGPFKGLALSFSLNGFLEFTIQKFYKLEPLTAIDKSVWSDNAQNPCNIMAGLVFERCDESVFRDVFQKRMVSQYKRLRC